VSGPYAVAPAEWRYDETEPPVPRPSQIVQVVHVPHRSSKLPWIIATIVIAAAAAAVAVFYTELKDMKTPPASEQKTEPVVMKTEPAPAPTTPAVPAATSDVNEDKTPKTPEPENTGDVKEVTPVAEPEPKKVGTPRVQSKRETKNPRDKKLDKAGDRKSDKTDKTEKTDQVEKTDKDGKVEKVEKTDKDGKTDKIETKATPPPPPVSGPPGMVTIDSSPVYAVIYVDGKKLGETPLVNIKLAPGKHTVRAVSPSGSTKTKSITIESGKTAPVCRIEW
jgi:hypothetical protein